MISTRKFKFFLVVYFLFSFFGLAFAKSSIPIEVIIVWEGRSLQGPNLEAIAKLRELEPDIPLIQLLSPIYFYNVDARKESLEKIQVLLHEKDEVGLYLSSQRRLLQQARVIPRSKPTFWSRQSELNYCTDDCGLDIPFPVLTREESLRVFALADASIRKAGFSRLRTFAVRGGFHVPVLSEMALAFGYRSGLSILDPELFRTRFDQYPLSQWSSAQSDLFRGSLTQLGAKRPFRELELDFVAQGGFLDIQEIPEITKRFRVFIDKQKELGGRGFQIYVNQETAYLGVPRLTATLKALRQVAIQKELDLEFRTFSGEKNGRPLDIDQRISGNL